MLPTLFRCEPRANYQLSWVAELVTRKWDIRFDELMPIEAIRQSTMEKVQNFARFRLE